MGSIFLKRNEHSARDKLMEEIGDVRLQLENANARFDMTSDSDLVESAIYEIQSLKAKYRYLIRKAKALDLL